MHFPKSVSKLVKKPLFINPGRLFRILTIITLSLLLLAQLVLTTPGIRAVLTYTDKFEGLYGNSQTQSSTLGEITLTLQGVEPASDIEILQNGQPIAIFYEAEINITVSDNSVIEIDGRKVKTPFSVRVSKLSPNIEAEDIPQIVHVNSDSLMEGFLLNNYCNKYRFRCIIFKNRGVSLEKISQIVIDGLGSGKSTIFQINRKKV